MNRPRSVPRRSQAFTLVEVIGVLAIISMLAAVLVPRVFQTIGDAKVSNASALCASMKSAVNDYYGRYTVLGGTNGSDLGLAPGAIYEDWDVRALVAEGIAEKPFVVRLGNGTHGVAHGGSRLRIVNIENNHANSPSASDAAVIDAGAYNLDGAWATNDVLGILLVEGVIEQVDLADAVALNNRIDGTALGVTSGNDPNGRVKYFITTNNSASVRIYLAHK